MKLNSDKTIGEIVAEDYRTAAVFKNYKIDFCCNGNKKFDDVCKNKNIDADSLMNELNTVQNRNIDRSVDFNSFPLDLLADYIEKKHHRYVEAKIPEIKEYLSKLCEAHGKEHNELFKIKEEFENSAGELAMHMKKEELILFPYIRKMAVADSRNEKISLPKFGTVQNPIQTMIYEHNVEGKRFQEISNLSNNYSIPKDGCNTFRVAYSLLKEFEEDLHIHIHLENNILFPKSIELEKKLSQQKIKYLIF
jgi:regulator of cell morphogenesis and NO signaling